MDVRFIAVLGSFWHVLEGQLGLVYTTCSILYLSIANVFEDLQFNFCLTSRKHYGVNQVYLLNETRQDPSRNILLWGPSAKGRSWHHLCSSPQYFPTS